MVEFDFLTPGVAGIRAHACGSKSHGIVRLIAAYRPTTADPRLPAVALTALIDGLWLELSLGHAPFTPDEAGRLAEMWLDRLLD